MQLSIPITITVTNLQKYNERKIWNESIYKLCWTLHHNPMPSKETLETIQSSLSLDENLKNIEEQWWTLRGPSSLSFSDLWYQKRYLKTDPEV